MLFDAKEIEIASRATEPGCRLPERKHLINGVFSRFFSKLDFRGKKYLELGPGHYEFCDMVKKLGGHAVALELDPAMVELGRYRGHEVHQVNLAKDAFWSNLGTQYDGVFCRGAINATWFVTRQQHQDFVQGISSLIKPNGWSWVSPWNANPNNLEHSIAENAYEYQISCFRDAGFRILKCNYLHARRFALCTEKLPFLIFIKGLKYRHLYW